MNKIGIQQTRELLVAVGSLVRGALEANADGKITKWEIVKLAGSRLGLAIEACGGIGEVPAEIADLTVEESDDLYRSVMAELGWTNHHRAKNIFDDLFHWLRGTLITFHSLKNTINPPKAIVVQEIDGVDPP